MKIEKINIDKLIFADYNPRKKLTSNDIEYQKIKNSINEFGYIDPIIINSDNTIIGGFQRGQVLKDLGFKEIDVVRVDLSKDKEKVLNIALNKISGEWDFEKLELLLNELKETDKEFLYFSGFDDEEFEKMKKSFDIHFTGENSGSKDKNGNENEEDPSSEFSENDVKSYTDKILAPIYEPKMEIPPKIEELFNDKKYQALLLKIKKSKIDKNIKEFLYLTASRFIVFDFAKIAEYYCHAEKEVQEFMESLALIIIDFKKAIENGFIEMQDVIYSENVKEEAKNEK